MKHRAQLTQKNKPFSKHKRKKGKHENSKLISKVQQKKKLDTQYKGLMKVLFQSFNTKSKEFKKYKQEKLKYVPYYNSINICIVSFHESVDVLSFKRDLIQYLYTQNEDTISSPDEIQLYEPYTIHFHGNRRKERDCFVIYDVPRNLYGILDGTKCADVILCLFKDATYENTAFDDLGYELLSVLKLQGVPTVLGIGYQTDKKNKQSEKLVTRYFKSEFTEEDKILFIQHTEDFHKLYKELLTARIRNVSYREGRGYMMVDACSYDEKEDMIYLKGFVKGVGLNINNPIHITNVGDYSIRDIHVVDVRVKKTEMVETKQKTRQKMEYLLRPSDCNHYRMFFIKSFLEGSGSRSTQYTIQYDPIIVQSTDNAKDVVPSDENGDQCIQPYNPNEHESENQQTIPQYKKKWKLNSRNEKNEVEYDMPYCGVMKYKPNTKNEQMEVNTSIEEKENTYEQIKWSDISEEKRETFDDEKGPFSPYNCYNFPHKNNSNKHNENASFTFDKILNQPQWVQLKNLNSENTGWCTASNDEYINYFFNKPERKIKTKQQPQEEEKVEEDEEEENNETEETPSEMIEKEEDAENDTDAENDVDAENDADADAFDNNSEYEERVYLRETTIARERFKKYQSLQSFRTSYIDIYENLPLEYSRIYDFCNYESLMKYSKEKYLENCRFINKKFTITDTYCVIMIKNDGTLLEQLRSKDPTIPLVISSLLPFERKVTVVHMNVKKNASYQKEVRSKETFQMICGFRHFMCCPVFSEPQVKGIQLRSKYKKKLQNGEQYLASIYGFTMATTVPVFMIKKESTNNVCSDGQPNSQLAVYGNVTSCDCKRVIMKRISIMGKPFKIHKKKVVVKNMFYNPRDINYFKPVELHTKHGHTGKILESLGTHGKMKCIFNNVLKSHDVIYLYLYKRVYPKWFPLSWNGQPNIGPDDKPMTYKENNTTLLPM